ncbi:pilin [Zymobacter palmae]|uniref:Tfp pilus assembly protein, major pilin PilA n=1 Tax=Zymobacter palmae TaxID=33074 RepID=A0A348HDJ3_9GAMM|nr:pilin [Zymobacter palmae]BBG29695.1 Tfp pilus assembly protein, major pilin PilA [Zymobacter palmae]
MSVFAQSEVHSRLAQRQTSNGERLWAQSGFTLMEVMVVMAIIGILASIAVPAYQRYTAQAHITSAMGSLRSQQLDVEQFMMSGGGLAHYALEETSAAYGDITLTLEGQQPALHYRFNADSAAGIGEGSEEAVLHMVRKSTGGWACRAEGITSRLVPSDCHSS